MVFIESTYTALPRPESRSADTLEYCNHLDRSCMAEANFWSSPGEFMAIN